jgi:hypothetical protein
MLAALRTSSLPARRRVVAQLVPSASASACASQIAFQRLLCSLPRAGAASEQVPTRQNSTSSPRALAPRPRIGLVSPLLLSPAALSLRPGFGRANALRMELARGFSSGWGRDPWRRRDWLTPVKYGALFTLGAGAVIVSTSCTS